MAHNIFHTGFEFIEDKTSDLVDSAKKFGTDLYVDYKVNQMVDSFTDEFKGPTTITPEMAAEGWKPGLDGVPYNSKLNEKFEPGGIFYDPDVDKNTAIANAVASGEVSSAEAGTTPFELSQDLRQRTPSGTIYNPSMDAYNESSLFNYEGPGGVPEYTYGQGLRTGGAGYGTPPGPNLYYEGQYGEGFVEPGVADTAITLPPITMPAGVPQVPTSNTSTNTSNNTNNNDVNNNNGTNNYSSGIDSGLLNSYINESGIGNATQGSGMGYTGGVNEPGIGNATQGSGMGYSSGANEAGIGNATQGSGMGYSSGANEAGIAGTQQFMPSGMTLPADESGIGNTQQFMPSGMTLPANESGIGNTQQFMPSGMTMPADESGIFGTQQFMPSGMTLPTDESGIAGTQQFMPSGMTLPTDESGIASTQQFMPSGMTMPANESGIFGTQQFMPSGMTMPANESGIGNTQQQLPANTVTNPFEDSMSIPSIASPSESGTVNSMSYLSNNFPASYGNGNNMNLLTANDELFKEENLPYLDNPAPLLQLYLQDSQANNLQSDESNNMSGYTFGGSTDNPGFDELIMSGVSAIQSLFDSDEPSAEEVAESVSKKPSIWSSVMETIANTAGMGFPGGTGLYSPDNAAYNNNSGMTMPTSFINEPTGNIEGQDMYNAFVQDASDLAAEFPTADPSITYSESPLFNTEIQNALLNNQPTIYNTPPVGPPSVISAPPPRPTSRPVVATNPVTSKPFVSYGPPNMRR